jgi:cytidylate kinase
MQPAYARRPIATVITITGVCGLVIVTVSRAYGALGRAVTRGLAERLGYRLVDDDLPVVVAARLGTTPAVVESVENRPAGFGERFLRSLGTAVPEAFQPMVADDDLPDVALREVERLIQEAAAGGNAVIVGRVANVILAGRTDLVRVFLTAPVAWRAARLAASRGLGEAEALVEVNRVDTARRTFARDRYDAAWGDPRYYDLVLDVSTFGVDGAVAIVAAAVGARG